MKKLLSILTLIAILVTAFYTVPVKAAAEDYHKEIIKDYCITSKDGNWRYVYLCGYFNGVCEEEPCDKDIAIVNYRGKKTEVVIPETIDGHTVKGVGDFCIYTYPERELLLKLFDDNAKITKVSIPKTITKIGTVYYHSYWGASCDCDIEGECMHVGDCVDLYPSGDTFAYTSIFNRNITEFSVNKNNDNLSSKNGIIYNKDKTTLRIYPAGKTDEVFTLPENVKEVSEYAFANSKLKRVKNFEHLTEMPDGLFQYSDIEELPYMPKINYISSYAFAYCDNLKSVTIPLTVDKVNDHAFYYCKNLEDVDFGEIKTIKSAAFAQCSALKEVALPKSCSSINNYAFSNCKKLESFNCYDLTRFGDYVFKNCVNLKKINSENYKNKLNTNSIGSNAFQNCTSLENLTINTKSICPEAFKDCTALKDISLQNSEDILWIGENAFKNTAYVKNHKDGVVYIDDIAICYKKPARPETYIEIKEGTKYIAVSCLYKLDNLKAIYLPSSLNDVDDNNLCKCKNLKRVYIAGENTVFENPYYGGLPKNRSIKYYVKSDAKKVIEYFKKGYYNYTTDWDPEKVKNEEAIKAKEEILNEKPDTSEETTSSKNETVSQNKENTTSKFESATESTVSTDTESTLSPENETENNDMKKQDVKPKNNPLTVSIIAGSILLCIAGGLSAFFIYKKKKK